MKENSCFFTGHRSLSISQIEQINKRLTPAVENLLRQGVTTFLSGGALGFDQLAAWEVLRLRETHPQIRLVMVLPCKQQDKYWTPAQSARYRELLQSADTVLCLSETYTPTCMRERNHYLVEHAAFCVCALQKQWGGTAQTVAFANTMGRSVVNILDFSVAQPTRATPG